MKIEGTFLKRLGLASALIIAAGAWPLMRAAEHEANAVVAGAIGFGLSLANVLAGYATIVIGRGRSPQQFSVIFLGGMTVRMLAMLALLWICVSVMTLPVIPLVVSLFVCYLTYLAIEVHFLWSTALRK